ncbi:hypothetical protein [Chachezhania antarctica]|uniref:hypothetical protein n=1 Tax=Chachezhania antarctica TaxID=2340860 RepID=UPI000EB331BF|nr:hypothetical protein [Chachezhania antarctica]|tara:strand:+ start:43 stop:738 length:696 start_codon:yes stop_codon:yes gene_type:complete
MRRLRLSFAALLAVVALVACSHQDIPLAQQPKVPLGSFKLGHVIVIADKMRKGPVSRTATKQEWVSSLKSAVTAQLSRYQGDQYYNFGISVEGYALGPQGVPLLYNPRSLLIIRVTVWDDAYSKKLNEKVHQISVFEDGTSETFVVGSGGVRTKAQQMAGLSANAAEKIEDWLAEMHETNGWFDARPDGKAGDRPRMRGGPEEDAARAAAHQGSETAGPVAIKLPATPTGE